MRRGAWLATGVVVGAGGAVWVRRRVEAMAERVRSGAVVGDVAAAAEHGVRRGARRVRTAISTGVDDARAKEADLRAQLRLPPADRARAS